MKSHLFYLAIAGLSLAACNNKPSADTPVDVIDTVNHTNSRTGDTTASSAGATDKSKMMKEDSSFLATAHEIGTFEIEAAKLAQTKSANPKVKEFGAMMISDHTAMGKDVETLAQQKNINLPVGMGDDLKSKWDKLNGLSGAKFDKEYVDMNVKGHKDAIEKFEKASQNKDCSPEVQQLASNALPKLKAHKEHADMVQSEMK